MPELELKKKELFENMPVFKAVLKLAIPSIIGQLILVIYNMTDTFFVGQASKIINQSVANELVAGVTICMPLYMILTAISNLFGIGASSVISRSIGVNNLQRARNSARFAFYGCLFVTLVYCLVIFLFENQITNFLSGNIAQTAYFAKQYVFYSIVVFGIPTAINTLFSHILRAQGKSIHASIGIALGGILNCVLDPLFMFVLFPIEKVAIAAALATGLSNTIALIYYVILFIIQRKTSIVSIKFSKKAFKDNIPKEVLKIGLPACLMTLCENISYMILDNLVGTILISKEITEQTLKSSSSALAGIGVAKKLNMLSHSIVRGMSQGVLPLIGYNKSSGNRTRMKKVVYTSGLISLIISSLCTVVFLIFAKDLSNIFVHEEDAIARSCEFLKILCIGGPFSAISYTIISFFQAVGKAWRSLILALLRKGILDIPLMYIFYFISVYILNSPDPKLIIYATPIADIVCSIVSLILFLVYLKYYGQDKEKVCEKEYLLVEKF